ncbi:hypothetical protein CV102_18260 [Natronococcus pandeyae]|uniref:Uncharacterized protein n=1 Tax=Natronococcus pandeyae TaxID=2055836 RepID=A0A8J8TP00_9EURY|nr:hypothetical protein [Natronococcus pandeyae]TYL37251.1 hypothetical protein CV102_18260 [Natronococcus pandeyae]
MDEDFTRRQWVTVAAGATGGLVLAGPRVYERGQEAKNRAQGADARPFIETACEHLEANYDHLSSASLASPRDLATLDIEHLDENLQAAGASIEEAHDRSGNRFLNDEVVEMLTAVEDYSQAQRLLLDVLDAPVRIDDGELTDEFLDEAWRVLRHDDDPADGFAALGRDPYALETVRLQLDDAIEALRFDPLEEFLDHAATSVTAIVDNGLGVIAELRSLYLHLRLHALLPAIEETVLAIDESLSQTATPADATLENQGRLDDLRYELGVDARHSLSDELAAYEFGSQAVAASEIERSVGRFHDAIRSFENSLGTLDDGHAAESSTQWTDGLTALYHASRENPLSAL